jgi:putative phosphoesterase
VEIAIISDTHMPRTGRRLPQGCVDRLSRADLIVHAGDFTGSSVLDELGRYGDLVAVHGNVDEASVKASLPQRRLVTAQGATIGLVHDAGPARGRLERLRLLFPDADAVVFGHSHIPLHDRAPDGFQIFNPGSPTERRRSPRHTIGIGRVRGGRLSFELVALD